MNQNNFEYGHFSHSVPVSSKMTKERFNSNLHKFLWVLFLYFDHNDVNVWEFAYVRKQL